MLIISVYVQLRSTKQSLLNVTHAADLMSFSYRNTISLCSYDNEGHSKQYIRIDQLKVKYLCCHNELLSSFHALFKPPRALDILLI